MFGAELGGLVASIPSPSVSQFDLGPFTVNVYGLMAALGMIAGILITGKRWANRGGDTDLVWEVALWAIPSGVIGGRLYHVITSPDQVPSEWWGVFAIWDGGLGAWGGIALGAAVAVLVLRYRGVNVAEFLDAGAPAIPVGFAIGRIGNYFNQELFGRPTELPWGLEIDPANRPGGYEDFATFHPTFLYEMLWNLGLAGVLIWLGMRAKIRPPGLFALVVVGYSLGRLFLELVRIDPAQQIVGMRLNFWVALALVIAGSAWFAWAQGWIGRRREPDAP